MEGRKESNSQCCCWDFYLPVQYEPDRSQLVSWLTDYCKAWAFQIEKGEETGVLHYQGRFSLFNKMRKATLKECLPWSQLHFSQTVNGQTKGKAFYGNYVQKSETRVEGPWTDKDEIIEIPRQIKEIMDKLHPWQESVKKDFDVWNTRSINIIADTRGNTGKTSLMLLLRCLKIAYPLPYCTDYKEIMASIMDRPKDSKGYFLDVPRSVGREKLHMIFAALETAKGGYAFDHRFRFRDACFNSPNIWVNINLNETELLSILKYLSLDRWRIWRITSSLELKRHRVMATVEEEI